MRALMWFRSDLRLADNPALAAACRMAQQGVVGVFCTAVAQWRQHSWGDARIGWLWRHVQALQPSLAASGIPLHVLVLDRFGDCTAALLRLAEAEACDALFFNRELELNEARRDAQVSEAFSQGRRQVFAFDDQVLLPPSTVRNQTGGFYEVYTPFKRACLQRLVGAPPPSPEPPPPPAGMAAMPAAALPEVLPGVVATPGLQAGWPAGEAAAHAAMQRFLATRLSLYDEQRDRPDLEGTSGLSPYLAVGALSARQCLWALLQAAGPSLLSDALQKPPTGSRGPVVWLQELLWREFYRPIVVGAPRVCMHRAFQARTEAVPWRTPADGQAAEQLAAWQAGRTGVPIVDAAMRQLHETGWMHNRLRMIVAMFLSKDLLIDWRLGERHFMQHLVDGDLASNNGGWQWSASTGTDAAPYFRIFNPVLQSQKFDPEGRFIKRYLPQLASLDDKLIHDPSSLGPSRLQQLGYWPPLVEDRAQAKARVMAAFAPAQPATMRA